MNVNKININQSEPTYYIETGAYDVTANNNGATFASLSALFSSENLSTLIPTAVRCGGMTIRFVQSSDNKYVQYRYMSSSTAVADFTNVANWQGVDDEPVAGSKNLVESDGVCKALLPFKTDVEGISYENTSTSTGGVNVLVQVLEGKKYILKNTSTNNSINSFLKLTELGSTVQTIVQGLAAGAEIEFTAEVDAPILRVYYNAPSSDNPEGGSCVLESVTINDVLEKTIEDVNQTKENVNQIEEEIIGSEVSLPISENSGKYYGDVTIGSTITSELDLFVDDSGYYKAIDLSGFAGKILKFKISKDNSSQSTRCTIFVVNNIVVLKWFEEDIINENIVLDIPSNAVLYESHSTLSTFSASIISKGVEQKIQEINDKINNIDNTLDECYVAENGSDTNTGSKIAPFATIAHAITAGFKSICVKAGNYKEILNLQNVEGLNIYAFDEDNYDSNPRKRPVFTNGEKYTSFQTDGGYKKFTPLATPTAYTNVFVNKTIEPIITYQGFPNTYNAGLWAVCDDIKDDFMFKPVLTMGELSENNTFFFDGTDVYFNTNAEIDGVIVVGDSEHIAQITNCNNLHLSGLVFQYGAENNVNINASNNIVVENCKFTHSLKRGGLSYTRADIVARNCEAYKNKRDGFGAAWYGVAILENCRSNYNYDDGESSHEWCEVVVIGGEYAYNGKAGHAPVNGCKFSCNGTYTHHNAVAGLYYVDKDGFETPVSFISNSAFINNGTYDIQIDHDAVLMNCKYNTIDISAGANVEDLTNS